MGDVLCIDCARERKQTKAVAYVTVNPGSRDGKTRSYALCGAHGLDLQMREECAHRTVQIEEIR